MSTDPAFPPPTPPSLPPGPPPLPPAYQSAGALAGPLAPEHLQQIAEADLRAKKLRKAGSVAAVNGWTFAIFAALSGMFVAISPLCGCFDFTSMVVTVGLALVAWNEFKGRQMLRRFDRRGPRLLGWNQVCLMVLIIGYCIWMIVSIHLGAGSALLDRAFAIAGMDDPMIRDMLPSIGSSTKSLAEQVKLLSQFVFVAVIVATLIFQGLNAAYYFTRGKLLRAYLAETPAWVVEVQRRSTGA